MKDVLKSIREIEENIEEVLNKYEIKEENKRALEEYKKLEKDLTFLAINDSEPEYFKEYNRVLAYLYMREGNILRILGKAEEAIKVQKLELEAAQNSEDEITLARLLFSSAVQNISSGNLNEGTLLLEEALKEFNKGNSSDHKQGAGWIWIIRADIMNAGIIEADYQKILETCNNAIELLEPINNWQGLVRAYQARATAHRKNNLQDLAEKDEKQAISFRKNNNNIGN